MGIMNGTERLMVMDDATWARHANPLSVYTRIPILALLVLAIWSRVWLGWWALAPIVLLVFWTWVNPRAFPVPARLDSWASRVVLGERLYLATGTRPIPKHQAAAARRLSLLGFAGLPFIVLGLIVLDPWMAAFGTVVSMLGKLWFCDRMVWLYEEMTAADPSLAVQFETKKGVR